jgi:hypothetical protein
VGVTVDPGLSRAGLVSIANDYENSALWASCFTNGAADPCLSKKADDDFTLRATIF